MEDLLDYEAAAKLLGVKKGTLCGLVFEKRVPHIRLGRRLVRFERRRLLDWLKANCIEPVQD